MIIRTTERTVHVVDGVAGDWQQPGKVTRTFMIEKMIERVAVSAPAGEPGIRIVYTVKLSGREVKGVHLGSAFVWAELDGIGLDELPERVAVHLLGPDALRGIPGL